jgi:DNA-binding MarR family transcriptional regulator
MVDYLVKRGYVVRQPHPTDRRGKLIILTERGWSCVRAAEAILSQVEGQWASIIGLERLADLRADLQKLMLATNRGTLPQKFRPTW